MRILLTGITGQVGGALQAPLSRLATVLAADRKRLNLSEPETIPWALDRLRPDMIVNPAAYTAVDLAEDERELAYRVNAEAPAAIAEWAAQNGVPLVHFSSDYVFDGSGEAPWGEDDMPAPLSVYGASKFEGERAVMRSGCRHLIVRTSWVYAAEGRNFLRTIARLAAERKELRIVADQFGAPTSARTVAQAVLKMLRRELSGEGALDRDGPVVHVTASGYTSWHGFAEAIVTGLRARGERLQVEQVIPIETSEYPTRATRPQNSRMDISRLNACFGIAMPSWRRALSMELDQLTGVLVGSDDFQQASLVPQEPVEAPAQPLEEALQP
jgi:dTDP-4-dehydrorhamnose reductase